MLRYGVIFRILGILLMLFSSSYIAPFIVSLIYQDQTANAYIYSLLITASLGLLIWLPAPKIEMNYALGTGL